MLKEVLKARRKINCRNISEEEQINWRLADGEDELMHKCSHETWTSVWSEANVPVH